ncbi:hypothetical protein HN014_22270 (plasmid) [Aquimarina sp. TRL1]|uniref:hypothetical protein n=1 Tax=Aquimarina sp. (strain TRL1) TaxID=2736252 RepID=UPI00158A5DFA|nr:hypothetical protein [Aquimarina sp. TRL1]QKX07728.1 hypothetical protein HN014_22270 [Aquimarina sp. TRL1]
MENRESQLYKLSWNKIDIQIKYTKNYWKSAKVSHLEIKSDEPLPFTETGYKSIWLYEGELEDLSITDYVFNALEIDSKSSKWQKYLKEKEILEIKKTQLSLF